MIARNVQEQQLKKPQLSVHSRNKQLATMRTVGSTTPMKASYQLFNLNLRLILQIRKIFPIQIGLLTNWSSSWKT
ncbi:hypothetical protein AQUCO_00500429v1 [Aquilegia coerulea]|uniref:Uncharacterized protein n=1 Tax=Aquilegia coerulea TaxID=218851 RepID=A0A2G5ERW5_AQUCA|nr:hypothetical protein AQUCO_00500429v1 [Aquilegia coerulea]